MDGGLGITRAFIYHVASKETGGAHLLTMHNVHHLLALMAKAREAIIADQYPQFVKTFFKNYYGEASNFPEWAVTALKGVGIQLLDL